MTMTSPGLTVDVGEEHFPHLVTLMLQRIKQSVAATSDASQLTPPLIYDEKDISLKFDEATISSCSVDTFLGHDIINRHWDGMTLLSASVVCKEFTLVKLLVDKGANVNINSRVYDECKGVLREESPLITASRLGWLPSLPVLLGAGALIDATDPTQGKSSLHWACKNGWQDVAVFLISHGANVNSHDYTGETPIVEAIGGGNLSLVQYLLEAGVRVNQVISYDRDTALLLAVAINKFAISKLLLESGANVNVLNRYGEDALRICLTNIMSPQEVTHLANILLAAGAKVLIGKHVEAPHRQVNNKELCVLLNERLYLPPSLADFSRLVIRKTMMQCQTIQGFLLYKRSQQLPLPLTLIDFVNLR